MKRHVVGKKCIRHYAAGRVLASFGDASELLCVNLKTQSSTGTRMPAAVDTGRYEMRLGLGSNQVYPRMEQLFCRRFAPITTLEVVPVALEGPDDCADFQALCFYLGQLQSWKQLDAYNCFHCSYERTIL